MPTIIDGLTRSLQPRRLRRARDPDLETSGWLLGAPPESPHGSDIDHFKRLNDSYGHPTGDEALRRVSECLLRTFLRKEDFVARYGGEEFAVVLMDASLQDALARWRSGSARPCAR